MLHHHSLDFPPSFPLACSTLFVPLYRSSNLVHFLFLECPRLNTHLLQTNAAAGFVDDTPKDTKDPFGNSSLVPMRFRDAETFESKVKVQHPCYTTTGHDIGIKRPSQVDMPVKWRGKEGVFTTDFVMQEPGKMAVSINNYTNRGLRTNKTYSKVHRDFDVDF